ncbi:hypothetical protein DNTS_021682 [Danionella cerebrum]|uniref:Thymus, brain and testes associated n=1 Tax=Danionella cerebrum TaxID=2873325 RepID=A0A553N3I3_9TELE|nr:hypothetical protein DNTS_021682 [Danionella translucida]
MASSAGQGSVFGELDTESSGGSGGRSTSRGRPTGSRFGSLSHHSFFSRHNPHPHRVRHMQGLNGKPVCTVNDDWFTFTPLCPHPLIKSQVYLSGIRTSEFHPRHLSRDHTGPAADEDRSRRQTQYSSQTGRIIPNTSWGGKRRSSRLSHRRTGPKTLDGMEIKVLELLCQILQTDSLSMVQQWLLLASNREKQLVQGLLSQAMGELSSLKTNTQSSAAQLLPLTAEDLLHNQLLDSRITERQKSSSAAGENVVEEPERIGQAEVFTLRPEESS